MKIKNYLIQPMIEFLHGLELSGKDSRMRTRFIKLLTEQIKLIQDEQLQLLEEYSMKDNEGNSIKKEANGRVEYEFEPENKKIYNNEFNTLINEEFIIDENEKNKNMLLSVSDSVLNFDGKLKGDESTLWDNYCEIFEELSYEDEKED